MIESSLAYLESPAALASMRRDPYWPKWDSPWWHMLLLHEMGYADQIPRPALDAMVDALNGMKCHTFPFEIPEGLDPSRDVACHCAVGTMYGVLTRGGVEVDVCLPWMRPWLSAYQMADGGMTCDNEAYLIQDECPSSMVGLVPCFEALVRYVPEWTSHERTFLERGAQFLLGRELRLGSSSRHNAQERESAPKWLDLCFPRFYFYDVLRGLSALLEWAHRTGTALPGESIAVVMAHLEAVAPDGVVRPGRQAYRGPRTATLFALLEQVSVVGKPSEWLTREYAQVKAWL